MKKIILIDGNSLMFRSYYATAYTGNLMQNKQGLYTNAIFGFCNMLNKILEEEYDNIFVAFDAGKKTFRHLEYTEYKGGRKPMPEEFAMQIPYIKRYLDILNIKRYEILDYEADDLIATLSELAKDYSVKVITGDKDLLQLVNENINVCITRKGVAEIEEFNIENFKDKMGILPSQVPDYKGLIGDSSDNLSGIKGIGPKTAVSLLETYGTLENIIENVSNLKGKLKELIENGKDIGLTCKRLATLVKDINLDFGLIDTEKKDYNVSNLISFYEEVGFNSFIKRIKTANTNIEKKIDNVSYKLATIDTDFSNIKECYISLEVFGDSYYDGTSLGIALKESDSYFIYPEVLEKNVSLKKILVDKDIKKNTFDFKKLYVSLKKMGIEVKGLSFDLLLASYLINPSYASDDMKKVLDNFKENDLDFDEVIYGYKSKAKIPEDSIYITHAVKKVKALEEAKEEILNIIKDNKQLELLDIEMNLSTVLGDMEVNGLMVDINRLDEIGKDLEEKAALVVKEIYTLAGEEFNINSVKQLGDILFNKLGLPASKKNKTGYATGIEVLEKLAPKYEIVQKILDYRAINKIVTTYIHSLSELVSSDKLIHPLYKQALTLTGRLSSINPNIQNMPIRTELGKVIRDVFVSRFDGGSIVSSDYSQIELRVLAHMADDPVMIAMFKDDTDFHTSTAIKIYDVSEEEVTKDMRRSAKAINFGIVYGMSAWGLSESLNITPFEATTYINKYFMRFNKVKEYLDNTVLDAKNNGYTKTILNRLRYIPELKSENKALEGFGERTAMNAPIQGSAADIIKIAMVNVSNRLKNENLKSLMIAQVHDELVFDCFPDEEEKLMNLIKEEMENAIKLSVPLKVECIISNSWLKE